MQVLEALIKAGCDVNALDVDKNSPLHSVVEYDDIEAARLLLAAGADPNITNRFGQTALNETSNRQMIKILTGARGNTDPRDNGKSVEDMEKYAEFKRRILSEQTKTVIDLTKEISGMTNCNKNCVLYYFIPEIPLDSIFFNILADLLDCEGASFDVGLIFSELTEVGKDVSLLQAAAAFDSIKLVKSILRKADKVGLLDKVVQHRDDMGRVALHFTSNVEVYTYDKKYKFQSLTIVHADTKETYQSGM